MIQNTKPIGHLFIQLIILQCLLIVLASSLSITPGHAGVKSSLNLNGRHMSQHASQSAQLQQQQQQPVAANNNMQHHHQQSPPLVTTLPPLMTTIVQNNNNNIDSSSSSPSLDSSHHVEHQPPPAGQVDTGAKFRSNLEEHDDSVPLATINNHSKNNAQIRPPQYVDVSALVGTTSLDPKQRDRNLTSGGSFSSPSSSSSSSSAASAGPISSQVQPANSLLSAKSRSGLPECATQQVCNAIFVRMNYTQRLCECSSNYNWKCSNNLDPQDGHTIELTRKYDKRIYTQIKTCEPLREVRACKSPTDWTLLALQSERSGKAHYVVVCKCPTWAQLEGPYTHNHPPYANIPGIRVYGMLCAHQTARSSSAQTYSAYNPSLSIYPEFPWPEAMNVLNTTNLLSTLDSTSSSSASSLSSSSH